MGDGPVEVSLLCGAVMFEEALHRAKAMDRAFDATGIAEGAFWGLPSSFKGQHAPIP